MLFKFLLSLPIFLLLSCKQKIEGYILDKGSKKPIDSVAVAEHSFFNSYPYPYQESNKHGFFSFTKENRNSILYFYKKGYGELRVDFDLNSILETKGDTIYLTKKE